MTESKTAQPELTAVPSDELDQLRQKLQETHEQLVYYASNHTVLERKTKLLTEKLSAANNEAVDKDVTIGLLQEQISILQKQSETQVVYPTEG